MSSSLMHRIEELWSLGFFVNAQIKKIIKCYATKNIYSNHGMFLNATVTKKDRPFL